MGETVSHDTGQGAEPPRRRRRFGVDDRGVAPLRRRQPHRAPQQAVRRAAHEQRRAVVAHDPENDAVAQRPHRPRRPARQFGGGSAGSRPAPFPPRTIETMRPARRADRRAEVHRRLRIVAGAALRRQFGGAGAQLGPRPGQGRLHREKPRHDPFDIAVHHRRRPVEGDGRHRRRRIGADAGQPAQAGLVRREPPAMRARHFPRASVKVARAGVVAEARPGAHDRVEIGVRKRLHRRPCGEEAPEIARDGRCRGLLQHRFAEPDGVRVRSHARRGAPRQVAAVAVEPCEQRRRGVLAGPVLRHWRAPVAWR